jgi:CheY-like chemotaxis protein
MVMETRSVLVVQDEPNIQETLAVVLTLVGFKAYRAGNVEEALRILGEESIDAISLDVDLPDPEGLERDGLTLLKYLRSVPEFANLPVLFTGVELEPEEEALVAGLHVKVFYKPQPYSDLIDELNRVLHL